MFLIPAFFSSVADSEYYDDAYEDAYYDDDNNAGESSAEVEDVYEVIDETVNGLSDSDGLADQVAKDLPGIATTFDGLSETGVAAVAAVDIPAKDTPDQQQQQQQQQQPDDGSGMILIEDGFKSTAASEDPVRQLDPLEEFDGSGMEQLNTADAEHVQEDLAQQLQAINGGEINEISVDDLAEVQLRTELGTSSVQVLSEQPAPAVTGEIFEVIPDNEPFSLAPKEDYIVQPLKNSNTGDGIEEVKVSVAAAHVAEMIEARYKEEGDEEATAVNQDMGKRSASEGQ